MEKISLVVMHDDPHILNTLIQGLINNEYQAMPASSCDEALNLLQRNEIDLALVDFDLGGASEPEFTEHLREKEVPFITLTARSGIDVVNSMIRLGALCYLVKPVGIPELIPAVETAISRSREIRRLRHKSDHLEKALQGDRSISTAVGILMERYKLRNEEAFEQLRGSARSQQRQLREVAHQVVIATDSVNAFNPCKTS